MSLKQFSLMLALVSNLSACTGLLTHNSAEDSWRSEREAGLESLSKRNYYKAETQLRSALTHAKKLEKESPSHYAQSLQEMGDLNLVLHKTNEAKSMYEQALKAYEIAMRSPNLSELSERTIKLGQAKSHLAIGKIDLDLGNYAHAEKQLKAAYELSKDDFGGHPIMPEIKKDLALALTKQSRAAEAKAFLDDRIDDPLHGL